MLLGGAPAANATGPPFGSYLVKLANCITSYRKRESRLCGAWLACANIATAVCCRI